MSYLRPTRVVVDGLELNRDDEAAGVFWRFLTIKGWHKAPAVQTDEAQRVDEHGQFGQPGHRTGKKLTVRGQILAADRSLMPAQMDLLNRLLADGGFGVFEFHDRTDGMRWTTVQLFGEPDYEWDGSPTLDYQMILLAPDSYRFGATSSDSTAFGNVPGGAGLQFPLFTPSGRLDFGAAVTTGSATVSNPGTAPASVLMKIAGPTPDLGFVITDTSTGARITYTGAVPSGSELVIDSSNGSIVIDGIADRLADTFVERWPSIPAGGSATYLFEPLGARTAAVLTVECIATYW